MLFISPHYSIFIYYYFYIIGFLCFSTYIVHHFLKVLKCFFFALYVSIISPNDLTNTSSFSFFNQFIFLSINSMVLHHFKIFFQSSILLLFINNCGITFATDLNALDIIVLVLFNFSQHNNLIVLFRLIQCYL